MMLGPMPSPNATEMGVGISGSTGSRRIDGSEVCMALLGNSALLDGWAVLDGWELGALASEHGDDGSLD